MMEKQNLNPYLLGGSYVFTFLGVSRWCQMLGNHALGSKALDYTPWIQMGPETKRPATPQISPTKHRGLGFLSVAIPGLSENRLPSTPQCRSWAILSPEAACLSGSRILPLPFAASTHPSFPLLCRDSRDIGKKWLVAWLPKGNTVYMYGSYQHQNKPLSSEHL